MFPLYFSAPADRFLASGKTLLSRRKNFFAPKKFHANYFWVSGGIFPAAKRHLSRHLSHFIKPLVCVDAGWTDKGTASKDAFRCFLHAATQDATKEKVVNRKKQANKKEKQQAASKPDKSKQKRAKASKGEQKFCLFPLPKGPHVTGSVYTILSARRLRVGMETRETEINVPKFQNISK